MCASSPPRTKISRRWCARANSARIFSTGSTSCPSTCRRCASGARTFPLLINAFLQEFARQNEKKITGFSADAQEALQRYDWPGNVRELRAAIEHAVALCRGERIGAARSPGPRHRPGPLRWRGIGATSAAPTDLNLEKMEKKLIRLALQQTRRQYHRGGQAARHQPPHPASQDQSRPSSTIMNITQGILHAVEEGKARILTRLFPFVSVLIVIILWYDFHIFTGLNDMQSMDNAQLARQIDRGNGFTTKFIRPAALAQMNAQAIHTKVNGKSGELFPATKFPGGTQRVLPDTYNAPGYPYLLAGWFKLLNLHFDQTAREIAKTRYYAADRDIPWLNQIFLFLTAGLTFLLGWRLFDPRVAWLAMTAFFLTDLVWQYSITATPANCLMFLLTGMFLVAVEIFAVGEACFESSEALLLAGVALDATPGRRSRFAQPDPAAPARAAGALRPLFSFHTPPQRAAGSSPGAHLHRDGRPLVLVHVQALGQPGRFQRCPPSLRLRRLRGKPDLLHRGRAQLPAAFQGRRRQGIHRFRLGPCARLGAAGRQSARGVFLRLAFAHLQAAADAGPALAHHRMRFLHSAGQ